MGADEDIVILRNDLETCRTDMYKDIKELKEGHVELRLSLREHALARKENNDKTNSKIDDLAKEFKEHTNDEMGTMREIRDVLNSIVDDIKSIHKQTDNSESFIEDFKHKKFKYTMILTGVVSTLGALYTIYTFLQKNGVVFVIEKVGN